MIDEAGKRYGRLVVIERAENKGAWAAWLCICDCGIYAEVVGRYLRRGNTRSCGCLGRESARRVAANLDSTTHGRCGTPEYGIWNAMKSRCGNPGVCNYRDYGGRGIRVCGRWDKFENFFEDMGERPTAKHSLDRIDNNGNYTPENCRWATVGQQARNKSNTYYVTHNGKTQCMTTWADEAGLKSGTLRYRLKAGWSVHRAVTTPVRH